MAPLVGTKVVPDVDGLLAVIRLEKKPGQVHILELFLDSEIKGVVWEMISFLFGYETMCYKMTDEPELAEAVAEKIGRYHEDYTGLLCEFGCVPLAWGPDDMGFMTSTLASPEFL
jgi:hypothetical protein